MRSPSNSAGFRLPSSDAHDCLSVHSFTGAHNQWLDIEGADDYHLTQTRRFGTDIAAAVNEILIHRGSEDNLIIPNDEPSTLYRPSTYERHSGELTMYPVYHRE